MKTKEKKIKLTDSQMNIINNFLEHFTVIDGMINGLANQRHIKNKEMWDVLRGFYPEIGNRKATIDKNGILTIGDVKKSIKP
jgi:hypothetical protein